MKAEFWLKIKGKKKYKSWEASTIVANKKKPDTAQDEVALKLSIEIPDSIFEKPQFEAKITIPELSPKAIDSVMLANHVEKELKKQTGFKVNVTFEDQK